MRHEKNKGLDPARSAPRVNRCFGESIDAENSNTIDNQTTTTKLSPGQKRAVQTILRRGRVSSKEIADAAHTVNPANTRRKLRDKGLPTICEMVTIIDCDGRRRQVGRYSFSLKVAAIARKLVYGDKTTCP